MKKKLFENVGGNQFKIANEADETTSENHPQINTNIREYDHGHTVVVTKENNGRWVLVAENEGGCAATYVDLMDVLNWAKENMSLLK